MLRLSKLKACLMALALSCATLCLVSGEVGIWASPTHYEYPNDEHSH